MMRYAVAAWAAVITGLGALAACLVGVASIGALTDGQWVTIATATLTAFGGVLGWDRYTAPSKPPDGRNG